MGSLGSQAERAPVSGADPLNLIRVMPAEGDGALTTLSAGVVLF